MRRTAWSNAGTSWNHELVGYALDLYHRRNLRVPTVRELRAGIEGLPSHSTIRRMYGCVSVMYQWHGYKARKRGAQPGRRTTLQRDVAGRFLPKQQTAS
jgi:hypothetical protein